MGNCEAKTTRKNVIVNLQLENTTFTILRCSLFSLHSISSSITTHFVGILKAIKSIILPKSFLNLARLEFLARNTELLFNYLYQIWKNIEIPYLRIECSLILLKALDIYHFVQFLYSCYAFQKLCCIFFMVTWTSVELLSYYFECADIFQIHHIHLFHYIMLFSNFEVLL